jgi:hypothetical protein
MKKKISRKKCYIDFGKVDLQSKYIRACAKEIVEKEIIFV